MLSGWLVSVNPAIAIDYSGLSWENPTTDKDGKPLAPELLSALNTVIEVKKLADPDTAWTQFVLATEGANTVSVTLPNITYSRGMTLQFRAKSRLVYNDPNDATKKINVDSGYSNIVEWAIPFIAPDSIKNLQMSFETTSQRITMTIQKR